MILGVCLLVQACFMRGPDVSGTLEGAGGSRGVLAVLKDASTWKAVAADTLGNAIAAIGSPEVKEQAEKNLKALGRGVKRAVTDIPDDVKEIAKGIASAASKAVDPETYIEMADAIAMLYKCRQNPCCWKKLMESLGEMPSATLEAAARKLKDLGNLKQEEVFEMLGKEWARAAMMGVAAEAGGSLNAAKTVDEMSQAGKALDKGGQLTKAGRSAQKHGSRPNSAFPPVKGNPAEINQQGQHILDDILTSPGQSSKPNRFGGQDIHAPDGRGARFDAKGNLMGFLEPK